MNETATSNALSGARSAYLRSAMHQPVQWNEWGSEAFAQAQAEDKPILLDIGAVWCHWCHVMDRESYEDPETARLINEHFIAIKVDRDERPDVDARYQAAVAAISGQGGWPLTAFLTPNGRPFFGGTYFPPLDQHGRPGLRRVLMTMAEAFQKRREEVDETSASVMAAIEQNETFDGSAQLQTKQTGAELVERIIDSALKLFDPRFGGFGSQPKFPNSAALNLLIDEAGRTNASPERTQAARRAVLLTLEKMSKGGIYDHLAGGFHRYSVDERWVVPHFEKMSYDNSELLRNYVRAFQSFAEPECARIARETIAWVDTWLSDRVLGGFYASQDADESLKDDGDYFTWTKAEAEALLTPEESAIVCPFYDIGELGDMQHNPQKNVLHVEQTMEAVAKAAGVTVELGRELLLSGRAKLYAARLERATPFVDKTIYAGWNAMMISAYLDAGRVLEEPAAIAFALKTLDRILAEALHEDGTLSHVAAYADGVGRGAYVSGVLEDYLFLAHAALDAWEATGEMSYFNTSLALAETVLARFQDRQKGGFFDTEVLAEGEQRLGVLNAPRKPLQDAPTPGGNPVAASLLQRLAELTGRADLRQAAEATLTCFAGVVEHFGLYAASYGLALRQNVVGSVQIVVKGGDEEADLLEREAHRGYAAGKFVVRLRSNHQQLPPSLAETLAHLTSQEASFALVCRNNTCHPPAETPAELRTNLAV